MTKKPKKINRKLDPFLDREAQKYANPIPSREFIIQHLEDVGLPEKYLDLVKVFGIKKLESQEALLWRLKAMLRDGQLLTDRKGRYASVKQLEMLCGYVICHKDGYGFLTPEDGSSDIFLNPRQVKGLFPGDKVLVSVVTGKNPTKREGIVAEVLERNFTHIVGHYVVEKEIAFVIPINKNISQEIIVPKGKGARAKDSQIVMLEIIDYPTSRGAATGKIVKILGDNITSGIEVEAAIHAHGLPCVWSEEVEKEGKIFAKTKVGDPKNSLRKGLQHLPFITIDGEDAKDFDDAVYCERQEDNSWILYVAIADVAHYVCSDTALDKEAAKRGNSVYFPKYVVPMLPEVLSNELCSLKPKVERLVLTCEMRITDNGEIKKYEFYEATIKSQARLTYDGVFELLESKTKKTNELLPHLLELRDLYRILLKQRKVRGALDFSRVEVQVIFDEKQKIKNIKPVCNHYVHGMIEECMLAANVCASKFLSRKKIPALYRVHEGPETERLTNLRVFLRGLGLELKGGDDPQPINYADLLRKVVGRPDENLVNTVLLRSLRQAVYAPDNVGHFGLAYKAYTHFTSPIRRYPDLINHRAIKHLLHGGKVDKYPYTKSAMQIFGGHCSLTERRADDASRDVMMWLKCEFMKSKVGKSFAGIITGVGNFGVYVELKDIFIEGLVHITSLKKDYYKFEPLHHRLVGKHGGVVYKLGDPIRVLVAKVSIDEREIELELV